MLTLIFKNLWNRRGKHAWLFIELIVVTVLTWEFMDGPIVTYSDSRMPLGYNPDRLVLLRFNTLPESNSGYNPEENTPDLQVDAVHSLLARIRNTDCVEAATAMNIYGYLNTLSRINTAFCGEDISEDNLIGVREVTYWSGTDYFETYGIGMLPGGKSAQELSTLPPDEGLVVTTKAYAELFGPENGQIGRELVQPFRDTTYYHIAGIVDNIRPSSDNRSNCLVFTPTAINPGGRFFCTVRLLDGVSPTEYVRRLNNGEAHNLRAGNYYLEMANTYNEIIEEGEGYQRSIRKISLTMTVFFLLSLLLGVTGSFYLQTKRRVQEIGIHRSFGARRNNVTLMIMGEAIILATIAFLIGEIIYFNYAIQTNLYYNGQSPDQITTIQNWVSDFKIHFAVISAVVYALISLCVCIGSWLPARNAARVNPVEALREE